MRGVHIVIDEGPASKTGLTIILLWNWHINYPSHEDKLPLDQLEEITSFETI